MNFEMLHPADQIVMIMNRIYYYGMTTTSGGNLSIIDSDGVVWISPSGVDKGSLTRDDIMKILPDGTVQGRHKPSSEYPFHLSVYKNRPDIKAVLHAHPPALVAYSIVRKRPALTLIPNAKIVLGDVSIAPYAVPGSEQLGENIGAEFKKGYNTVMLENHGVCIGAESLFKAFFMFETFDYLARLQVAAQRIGTPKGLSEKHLEIYKNRTHPMLDTFVANGYSSGELDIRRQMCKLIKRAYDNRLFTSSQGTFSCRTDDNNFVITPHGMDREYLEPQDLVRIENGKTEEGKLPSQGVLLHKAIYEQNPQVNAVIMAHPPTIMAFGVTEKEFDARLIPESYIMLRTVHKYPFGCTFMQPEKTAQEISDKNPVVIIENDGVLITGASLLNAFDRLEVMEYSARSVGDTANIGDIEKFRTAKWTK
ncbi:MAG: class II aldolase/adducin family protein [Oscillospiraceae bacterium]|nr:class II aldolase/adducin family protein [Candidatus Equicaccousia limihippi]